MAKDILNHDSVFGGAFQANKTVFTFSGTGSGGSGDLGTGLLVQDLQAQYQLAVNKVWELGIGNRCYYIVGRPQGQLNLGRIVGPAPVHAAFITRFTDACQVAKNVITVTTNAGFCGEDGGASQGSGKVDFNSCLATSIGLKINAQDMIIQEQIGLMFSSMAS